MKSLNSTNEIYLKVFRYACKHFSSVIDTLSGTEKLVELNKKWNIGLENWFRTELLKALETTDIVIDICGRGSDLKLKNDGYLELKGATDLNFDYMLEKKPDHPILFLGKPRSKKIGYNKSKIEEDFLSTHHDYSLYELRQFKNNWYIGLICKN